MSEIAVEVVLILALVLANGLFSMAELAIVSSRPARLKRRADAGDRGARAALELSADSNRFLSTVQVGITLVGTLAGAVGGATLASVLAHWLGTVPSLAPYRGVLALGAVVVGISYLTLVLGELVPKRLALARPEAIASRAARPLAWLSRAAVPIVALLGASTELVLRVLRVRPSDEPPVTEDEFRQMIREATRAGVFAPAEQEILTKALRLDDLNASGLMTRRPDVVWLDVNDPPEAVRRTIAGSPHSQFPVCEGDLDRILGIVRVKDLLLHGAGRPGFHLKGLIRVPLFFFEGTGALRILESFKTSGTHFGIVLDEYGSVEGVLTLNDVLAALVGELRRPGEVVDPKAVRRHDGSWLLDGGLTRHEFEEVFDGARLPEGDFRTLAGFLMNRLGHVPAVAEVTEWQGFRFEVVDMDRNRVDKVLVVPPPSTA